MNYIIKEIDTQEDSLFEIAKFLQETFPNTKKFTPKFIKWQYAENPLGQIVGFNAWDNERIVSHFASIPIEMSLFGELKRGLLCLNVATNINYRGQKLFTILGEKTIQKAKEENFDFMIAVPNANSSHAFLKYFHFYLISPLIVKIGLGKKIYNGKKNNCFKSWDLEQYKWRLNSPANKYSTDRKQNLIYTPIGIFFKTISQKITIDNSSDLIFNNIGFRPINLYIGLGADTTKEIYFSMPSFIKRPPFNLVFKDLKGNLPHINKEDIFLQLIDLDTI